MGEKREREEREERGERGRGERNTRTFNASAQKLPEALQVCVRHRRRFVLFSHHEVLKLHKEDIGELSCVTLHKYMHTRINAFTHSCMAPWPKQPLGTFFCRSIRLVWYWPKWHGLLKDVTVVPTRTADHLRDGGGPRQDGNLVDLFWCTRQGHEQLHGHSSAVP